ncbi:MAG: prepilin-type N-terminal cleavage/methylation domain-containing protein [Eubacteriaceae bacterium]
MKNYIINKKAFTLIELIISIAIIAILLITAATILSTTLLTIVDEGNDTDLLYHAQKALEELTAGQISDLSGYPDLNLQTSSTTMTMSDAEGNNINIVGTYYVIIESGTSNIVLKTFIPSP